MQHRYPFLALLGAAAATAWLLWPVSSAPPWREELEPSAQEERLEARARPLPRDALERWLPWVDPDGVLGASGVLAARAGLRAVAAPAGETAPVAQGAGASAARPAGPGAPDPDAPLAGLRIVLDPGHHGGAWSEIEFRHFPVWAVPQAAPAVGEAAPPLSVTVGEAAPPPRLSVTAGEAAPPPHPDAVRRGIIREGDLAWATVKLLEHALAAAGAEVHLTRGPPPTEPFPAGADPRFDPEHEARLLLDDLRHTDPWVAAWARLLPARLAHLVLEREVRAAQAEELHGLYTRFDLRRRAALSREVDADLTLSLHYNLARRPELNYVMVFMPGYARAEELTTPSARHHALARLLEGDLDVTAAVGRRVGEALHRHLDMPPPPPFAPAPGTRPFWWPVDEDARLFARNLALVRRAPGPVLLLEGPFMNNPDEAARLLDGSLELGGGRYPARTRSYAEAVFEAVVDSAPLLQRRRADLAAPHAPPSAW